MTRFLSTAAIALAFTVGAGAQSAPQPQPQSPSQSSTTKDKTTKTGTMSSASKTVTLTGCLRAGDTPNSFALDNVQMGGKSGETMSRAEPSTGGAPAMGMSADMGQVKLVSTADINLKEHVGHEVEVSGTMTTAKGTMTKDKSSTTTSDTMGSGSSASSSSATGTSGAKSKETGAGAHTLRVRSLKHISETCTK